MLRKQRQKIGNSSTGIQVNGNINNGLSYNDVKQVFYDLFELNYPKIQEIARKEADSRVNSLIEKIEKEFNKEKEFIDTEKFVDPNIQYEMTQLTISAARFGEKSILDLLAKLFTLKLRNDCPSVIEQISGEALKILPSLSKIQLSILGVFILSNEAKYEKISFEGTVHAKDIESLFEAAHQYLTSVVNMQNADIVYHQCINCINSNVMTSINAVPQIIKDTEEFNKISKKEIIKICKQDNYNSIETFITYADKCFIGNYSLTAIGRLLGWLYLQEISHVDIKKLF